MEPLVPLYKWIFFATGGNSTLVYFCCEDYAIEESRVKGASGKIQQMKMSVGEHGFISLAIDAEGNLFGLHSMRYYSLNQQLQRVSALWRRLCSGER